MGEGALWSPLASGVTGKARNHCSLLASQLYPVPSPPSLQDLRSEDLVLKRSEASPVLHEGCGGVGTELIFYFVEATEPLPKCWIHFREYSFPLPMCHAGPRDAALVGPLLCHSPLLAG